MLNQKDTETLRALAQKYMAYAVLPRQAETRSLWYALNRRQMHKPMVLIDQLPWNELSAADPFLTCTVQDSYWRRVENDLRMTIYKWEHLPVDMVLPPYIVLPRLFTDDGYGIDAVEETLGSPDGVMAHMYQDILANEEDVEKIHTPNVVWRKEEEEAVRQQADVLFAGIAPYRMAGVTLHLGLWDRISSARGVTNCYIDLLDRPEHMHAIIGRLTDCTLELIDRCNELGAFDAVSTLCHCSHTFCDDLPSGEEGFTTSDKVWAFGLAQLFSSVSPEVTAEFEIPYMQKLFPKFGAVYYGCCEQLSDRLELIEKLPNVRKVSCSPWSDRERFAAELPKKYVMSNKPTPALLATDSFDEQAVRDDLRRTMAAAKANGLSLEMILKDVSTVRSDPARLWRWAEIAAEETSRF